MMGGVHPHAIRQHAHTSWGGAQSVIIVHVWTVCLILFSLCLLFQISYDSCQRVIILSLGDLIQLQKLVQDASEFSEQVSTLCENILLRSMIHFLRASDVTI